MMSALKPCLLIWIFIMVCAREGNTQATANTVTATNIQPPQKVSEETSRAVSNSNDTDLPKEASLNSCEGSTRDQNNKARQGGETFNLLLREIGEIEGQIALHRQKIELLNMLRDFYIENNMTIPELGDDYYKLLEVRSEGKFSSKSESGSISRVSTTPQHSSRSASDSRRAESNLMTKFIKKSAFLVEGTAHESVFLPTRGFYNHTKTIGDDNLTPWLLALIAKGTDIEFYDFRGTKVLTVPTGKNIIKLSANTGADEMFVISLADDGLLQLYVITATNVRIENSESNLNSSKSQMKNPHRYRTEFTYKLNFSTNVRDTLALEEAERTTSPFSPSDPQYYTSLLSFTLWPNKYFLIGTYSGEILIYFRNGTFGAKMQVASSPILVLDRIFPYVLYATKDKLGLMNPQTLENDKYICEKPGSSVIHAVVDLYGSTIFYALVESGEILIYELKPNSQNCKVISKRNSIVGAPEKNAAESKLLNIKNYILFQGHPNQRSLLAFNVSSILTPDFDALNGVSMTLAAPEDNLRTISYAAFKNGQLSSLIASVGETAEGNSKISIHEITIPRPPMDDWFSTVRLPIIIVSAVLIFGYHFCYKKKKDDEGQDEDYLGYQRYGGRGSSADKARLMEERLQEMEKRIGSSSTRQQVATEVIEEDEEIDTQEISYDKY